MILVGGLGLLLNCCSHTDHSDQSFKREGDDAFRKRDYVTAKTLYEKALQGAISGGNSGAGTAHDLTMLYFALADTSRRMGNLDDAVKYHKAEIETAAKSNPEDAIASWDALYGIYYKGAQFAQAEEAARAELAAVDKYLKPGDPRIELAVSNVIAVACRSGTCKDETELFTRLYQIRLPRYGPTATTTCAARQMLAESYMHKGKYAEAAELYKQNVDAYSKTAPNMVPDVTVVYAGALMKADKPREALAAVASLNSAVGAEGVKLWALRGDAYAKLGKNADALAAYGQMKILAQQTWGAKDEQFANYMVRYAELLKRTGRTREAAALDRTIESVYKDGRAANSSAH